MNFPILTTKLTVPPLQTGFIPRSRLVERLDRGVQMGHRLFIFSAPPGFGKTTLLSEWIFTQREYAPDPARIGWISLDSSDNDFTRFWSYILAAVRKIYPSLAVTIPTTLVPLDPPAVEILLAELINQVAAQATHGFLILDDFHVIENTDIRRTLLFCLENQPANLHLMVSTRMDPSFPLARLRARQQLTELREEDLRFTPQETARFMRQALSTELSQPDLATLEKTVEGWVAGLHLLALSIRGRQDVSDTITHLAGSNRFILDYLTEEVFDRQEKAVQQFLLETSVLKQLNADLCNTATGRSDSQDILEYLDTANLFIVPLDDERHWYRYHQLFRDLLRTRFRKRYPERMAELYRSAAHWYIDNGYTQEALDCALAVPDLQLAADIMEQEARLKSVLPVHWLDLLPLELIRSRPLLCAIFAASKAILVISERSDIDILLKEAEEGLEKMRQAGEADALYIVLVRGHIALTRAILCLGEGSPQTTIEMTAQALEQLPEELVSERCSAYIVQAQGYLFLGNTAKALASTDDALILARRHRQYPRQFIAVCLRQVILISAGKLNEAASLSREMLEEVRRAPENQPIQRLPELGAVQIGLGRILLEQYQLQEAETYLLKGLKLISRTGQAGILRDGVMSLCRLYSIQGKISAALEVIHGYTNSQMLSDEFSRILDIRVNLAAAATDSVALEKVMRWVKESEMDLVNPQIDPIFSGFRAGYLFYIVYIQSLFLIHRTLAGQPDQPDLRGAIQFLQRQLAQAEEQGRNGIALEMLILLSLAYNAIEDERNSMKALARALDMVQGEGYFSIFIEQGRQMYQLLVEAAQKHVGGGYVQKLLGGFPLEWIGTTPRPAPPDQTGLAEPISEREVEVLQLIAAGLSNQEIAEKLFLAVSTVKKHINNLYGKLSVNKRTEAVRRGRELGLL